MFWASTFHNAGHIYSACCLFVRFCSSFLPTGFTGSLAGALRWSESQPDRDCWKVRAGGDASTHRCSWVHTEEDNVRSLGLPRASVDISATATKPTSSHDRASILGKLRMFDFRASAFQLTKLLGLNLRNRSPASQQLIDGYRYQLLKVGHHICVKLGG